MSLPDATLTFPPQDRRCIQITRSGSQCKAWKIKGSDFCAAHGGTGKRPGAPRGNSNRRKTGFYAKPAKPLNTIEEVVADLMQRQSLLSAYIEAQVSAEDAPNVKEMSKLLGVLGQNASRIGRLLRDQRALSGASADGLLAAVGAVLDELSTELGVKL
jgi:hypothetical protein